MASETGSGLPAEVRDFRPRCPGCTPKKVLSTGAKPCSYYDCPGLPDMLKVTCDQCMFDFFAHDGQPKCDHTTCETARRLSANVDTYRQWLELITAEATGTA